MLLNAYKGKREEQKNINFCVRTLWVTLTFSKIHKNSIRVKVKEEIIMFSIMGVFFQISPPGRIYGCAYTTRKAVYLWMGSILLRLCIYGWAPYCQGCVSMDGLHIVKVVYLWMGSILLRLCIYGWAPYC